MKLRDIALALALCVPLVSTSYARQIPKGESDPEAMITVKMYREMMASPQGSANWMLMVSYVTGIGNGIGWANAVAERRKQPLYCKPEKVELGMSKWLDILDREIEGASARMPASKLDKIDIGLVLLEGLMNTFPAPIPLPCTNDRGLR